MTFKDLEFENVSHGVQALVDFDKYQLSIISSDMSYGGKAGLYEIGVFAGDDMVELPGITNENDTVKGFLTSFEVDAIMKKMYTITGKEAKQI